MTNYIPGDPRHPANFPFSDFPIACDILRDMCAKCVRYPTEYVHECVAVLRDLEKYHFGWNSLTNHTVAKVGLAHSVPSYVHLV